MAGQRAVLRLLLVVLVALGVAGMHTLGHPSPGGHGGAQCLAHHEPSPAGLEMAGHVTAVLAAGKVVVHGPDLGLDPSAVCLAILVALSLAALVAALLLGSGGRPVPAGRRRAATIAAGRGPPTTAPIGLHLADLSVLRI